MKKTMKKCLTLLLALAMLLGHGGTRRGGGELFP